ncbi:hypothetical protein E2320_012307 [Naja naja]|nr:hypothetical protein E2320_012307 [Naja naja]
MARHEPPRQEKSIGGGAPASSGPVRAPTREEQYGPIKAENLQLLSHALDYCQILILCFHLATQCIVIISLNL